MTDDIFAVIRISDTSLEADVNPPPQDLSVTATPEFNSVFLTGLTEGQLVYVGPGKVLIPLALGPNLSITEGSLVIEEGGEGGGGNGTAIQEGDPRLTDAREWSAATMTSETAAAGISTSRLATTAAVLRAAAAGWWEVTSGALGKLLAGANTPDQGRTALELGTAAQADTTAFASASALASGLAAKADLVGGVVPPSQIPAIAVVQYLGAVASQAAMLALAGQSGDWCVRTDPAGAGTWVLTDEPSSLLANWVQLAMPAAPVASINGQVGVVVLGTGDIAESGGKLFFTAARALSSTLAGFSAGAGTVTAADSILQAISKIVGNIAAKTQVGNSAPAALAATASPGTSPDAARVDHAHQRDCTPIIIPVGNETSALTAEVNKVRFRMPFAATLLSVRASCNTPPLGSTLIVDINEENVSVLGTKLSIDAGKTSSVSAVSAATIADPGLADDAWISIDIDQVGATAPGTGLKITLFVREA